jgi:hypothetical protein
MLLKLMLNLYDKTSQTVLEQHQLLAIIWRST